VFAVVGSASSFDSLTWTNAHPAMYTSLSLPGSIVLDIADTTLDARFLTSTGSVADSFRIEKVPGYTVVRPPCARRALRGTAD
jgi:hypothetical protein